MAFLLFKIYERDHIFRLEKARTLMERRGAKADGVEVNADADPARTAKRVALKSFILFAV